MNEDKQIDEMTKVIDKAKYDMWVGKAHQGGDFTNHSKNIAKALTAKGYRKASDVAEEIFAEIESKKLFVRDRIGNMRAVVLLEDIAELKKKYAVDNGRDRIAEFGKYSPYSWRYTDDEV